MTTPAQQRVANVVERHGVVTTRLVASELDITTGRAGVVLNSLLKAGLLDVFHGGGGTYVWKRAQS